MKLFAEGEMSIEMDKRRGNLKKEIESQDRNYLLNANETELVAYWVQKYSIVPIVLKEDELQVSDEERQIPAEKFPFDFSVRQGKLYPRQVIRYHLPFDGEGRILGLRPSTFSLKAEYVQVSGQEIIWEMVNFSNHVEVIKKAWDGFIVWLREQLEKQQKDVEDFNRRLTEEIERIVRNRKAEFLNNANTVAALGVPVRRSSNVPSTFSVPTPRKAVIIQKPPASSAPFAPEPTLSEEVYQQILDVMHCFCVEFERHPSAFADKDEEKLRDILLALLSPHFGNVTGETFNMGGKTDILIRHEGKNVFVAECAMWKGGKHFLGKIDQLLSYLTWRDSKVAVLSFVRNKDMSAVLETVKSETPKHDSFVRMRGQPDEGWLNYEFCLKGDRSRRVHLAVLLFHLPD